MQEFVGICIDYTYAEEPEVTQLCDAACSKGLRVDTELLNTGALAYKGMVVPLEYRITAHGEGETFRNFVEDWFGKEALKFITIHRRRPQ